MVVRLVDLPWMQPQELQRSLAYQAGDYLPIPVDEAELDYHVVGEFENAGGQRLLRVLLAAAQKEMLAGHLKAVTAAGTAALGVVTVTVRRTSATGALEPSATVRGIHAAGTGCTAGETLTSATLTDSSGVLRLALPYGTWTIGATRGSRTGTSSALTVTPTSNPTVTVVIR